MGFYRSDGGSENEKRTYIFKSGEGSKLGNLAQIGNSNGTITMDNDHIYIRHTSYTSGTFWPRARLNNPIDLTDYAYIIAESSLVNGNPKNTPIALTQNATSPYGEGQYYMGNDVTREGKTILDIYGFTGMYYVWFCGINESGAYRNIDNIYLLSK